MERSPIQEIGSHQKDMRTKGLELAASVGAAAFLVFLSILSVCRPGRRLLQWRQSLRMGDLLGAEGWKG